MMTADPRLTSNARIIPNISYQEAMELSHFGGAKGHLSTDNTTGNESKYTGSRHNSDGEGNRIGNKQEWKHRQGDFQYQ